MKSQPKMNGYIALLNKPANEVYISTDSLCFPGQWLNFNAATENGKPLFFSAVVQWVASQRLETGELVKKEVDAKGRTIETILGNGSLDGYFDLNLTNQYLVCCKRQPKIQ